MVVSPVGRSSHDEMNDLVCVGNMLAKSSVDAVDDVEICVGTLAGESIPIGHREENDVTGTSPIVFGLIFESWLPINNNDPVPEGESLV